MLRAQDPQQHGQAGGQQPRQTPEDPMMRLLASLARGGEGNMDGNMDGNDTGALPILPEDIQSATGIPSWATSMLMGGKEKAAPSAQEKKAASMWKWIHIVFSFLAGLYLLYMLGDATAKFGKDPPTPATAKNPFVLFALGDLVIHASRILLKDPARSRSGGGQAWLQISKDVARDGSIVLFMLGAANWWNGTAS
jgi:GET complex subunit GET2